LLPQLPGSTGSRTMLSYLVKPLADRIDRAFREE